MRRHLHLPLQSGLYERCAGWCAATGRANSRALVERVPVAIPEVAITADLMVGFPGETDAEHAESIAFVVRWHSPSSTSFVILLGPAPPQRAFKTRCRWRP